MVAAIGGGAIFWLAKPSLSPPVLPPDPSGAEKPPISVKPNEAEPLLKKGQELLVLITRLQSEKTDQWDRIRATAREAVEVFGKAAAAQPDSDKAYHGRARAKLILADHAGAIDDISRAIDLSPTTGFHHLRRGQIRVEQFMVRHRQARLSKEPVPGPDERRPIAEDFRKAERHAGQDLDTQYCRAAAFMLEGEFARASDIADREIARDGFDEWYRLRGIIAELAGNEAGATIDFDRCLQRKPQQMELYLARALARRAARDFDGAERDATTVLRLAPDSTAVQLLRAEARAARREYRGALEDCRAVLDRAPKLFRARLVQARCWLATREILVKDGQETKYFENASAALKAVLEAEPQNVEALLLQSEIHSWKGETELAAAFIDRALKADPAGAEAHAALCDLYVAAGDLDRALQAAEKAVRLAPRHAGVLAARGDARRLKGDHEKALGDYRDARIYNALETRAHAGFVRTLLASGDARGASEAVVHAMRADPRNPQYFLLRAEILLRGTELGQAFNDVETALSLDPNNPEAYIMRALLWIKRDKPALMLEDLKKAEQLRPAERKRIQKIIEENKPKPVDPSKKEPPQKVEDAAPAPRKLLNPWARVKPGTWYRLRRVGMPPTPSYLDIGVKEAGETFFVQMLHEQGSSERIQRFDFSQDDVTGEETLRIGGKDYRCAVVADAPNGSRSWIAQDGPLAGRLRLKNEGPKFSVVVTAVGTDRFMFKGAPLDVVTIVAEAGIDQGIAVQRMWVAPELPLDSVKSELQAGADRVVVELVDGGDDWSTRPPFPK
ncbi:MAG: tetratricopeptide repeat protein [Planctomycetes bacterium]|nr:tetratricopeptide repeat protein [Planctomycetota bacterium]